MNEKRESAAGVQINSTTFWILGGESAYPVTHASTEFIIQGQTNGVPGPNLLAGISWMCGVKRSEQEIFIIGGGISGINGGVNFVWIYDPQNGFARNQGPSLNTGRGDHSCSTMRDGETTFIIVAGGYNGTLLDSVEIYDPTDNTWHSGKTNSQPQKNFFNLLFSNQYKSKCIATTTKKVPKFDINEKHNLNFFAFFVLQVQLCLMIYFLVLWLNPLMVEGFCYLEEIVKKIPRKTEYWNCVLGPIHGTFWILLWKMEETVMSLCNYWINKY